MAARFVPEGQSLVFKPDGTTILESSINSNLNVGTAFRTTNETPARASDPLVNGSSRQQPQRNNTAEFSKKNLPAVVVNPMEQFASMNVLWTMACLTPAQFNDPRTYRNNPNELSNVVFSSAGRYRDFRAGTLYGDPEYFINNFVMTGIIGSNEQTGNSNAVKFSFDVHEPYSMGLLLQSMQSAAIKAGYLSYLDNAPFVLKMDIQGWDEKGIEITVIKPKFFVMKLVSTKFTVNEGGSMYKVEAIPYNHQAFSDLINTSYNDVKLFADKVGNVYELLAGSHEGSLMSFLNNNEKKLKADGAIKECDEYEIQFPILANDFVSSAGKPPNFNRATVDVAANDVQSSSYWPPNSKVAVKTNNKVDTGLDEKNAIATANLGFDALRGGDPLFAREGDQYDEKNKVLIRDGMTIDSKLRAFQFSQGQSLTSIINQIILSSDYAAKAIDPVNYTPQGFIKWFKLDIQVQLLALDTLTGDYARRIIYRVVPYYVHQSIFAASGAAPIGYNELMKLVVKEYEYIYTGQNLNILSFNVEINNLFYTGSNPKPEDEAAKTANQDQKLAEVSNPQVKKVQGNAVQVQAAQAGRARPRRDPRLLEGYKGGANDKTVEQNVAENFQQAFLSGNSADMVSINLEILGDPYWLVDNGLSNYFVESVSPTSQITNDGTMNYEGGNVYVYITFRTPANINLVTGLYDFTVESQESPFGGIYRVVMCENTFSDGTWKQKLKLLRMPGPQGPETLEVTNENKNVAVDKEDSLAVKTTEANPPKASFVGNNTADKRNTANQQRTGNNKKTETGNGTRNSPNSQTFPVNVANQRERNLGNR